MGLKLSPTKRQPVPTVKECAETYSPPKTKRKFKKPPIKSIDNKIVDSLRSLNIEREKINKADDLMGLYDVEHNSNINRSIRDNSIRNNSIIQDDADAEEEMDQPDEE